MPANNIDLLKKLEESAKRQKQVNQAASELRATLLTQEPDVQRSSPMTTDNRPSPVGKA